MKKSGHTHASQGDHVSDSSNKHGNHRAGSHGHGGHGHGGHGKPGKGVRPNRTAPEGGDTESIDDYALHCDSERTVLKLEFTMVSFT